MPPRSAWSLYPQVFRDETAAFALLSRISPIALGVMVRAIKKADDTGSPEQLLTIAATTTETIEHGLGRTPVGWMPARLDPTNKLELTEPSPPTKETITIRNTGASAVQFALWVF